MAPLPPKQNGVFKKILKCYDYKQYKMGLKLAKQILSNPETANHGETLAMKGLILNCMGKKEEAHEYVKLGLRKDLTSHVCWHVYGLLQRSEHKYDEAIKCYRNALKYDKENITILRDLSLLQIQMRDLEGFRDTRYQLFMLRSTQRVSWLSFAAAYHLLKDYKTAAKILDEFRRTQKQPKEQNNTMPLTVGSSNEPGGTGEIGTPKKATPVYNDPIDYDQSELLLYQVMILHEAGNYKEAFDFLNKNASQICDRLAMLEFKAEILLALGKNTEAAKLLEDQLIARNQENYLYYEQLERALNLDPNDELLRLKFYQSIQKKYPRSKVPQKIPLSFLMSPQLFSPIVDEYLRAGIRKFLPSLFTNIKPVYDYDYDDMVCNLNKKYFEQQSRNKNIENNDHGHIESLEKNDKEEDNNAGKEKFEFIESSSNNSIESRKIRISVLERYGLPKKIRIIGDLMLAYERNLMGNMSFDSLEANKNSENKTNILWVYYYLAQHYDYIGRNEEALEYLKKALDHTPTLIELLTLKGKIYKHIGEFDKASEQVNEAQRLDTADRYLNSKCAKYLLRANKIQQAEEMCSKFTRQGVSVGENLHEMQCMWFMRETAQAHYRMKQYGLALKKCYEIDNFFNEVTEDQFDFHTYCMRKMTLRAYIRLLRMEDVLRSHRFYFEAAETAIKIYLKLHDEPLIAGKDNSKSQDSSNQLSAAELKKIRSKERKTAAKQQQNQKQQAGNKHGANNNNQQATNDSSDSHSHNQQQAGSRSGKSNEHHDKKPAQNNDGTSINNNEFGLNLDPVQLEHPSDPLEKASRFLKPLMTLARQQIDTHLLAFEVYRRKNKLLLMLQSIKRASELEPFSPKLRAQKEQLRDLVVVQRQQGKVPAPVSKVLEIEFANLYL